LSITFRIIGAVILTLLAGLFSGLTLGLMSLESLELELLIKAGDERQAKYAKRIEPVRKSGNQLLCTLLLTNVAVSCCCC
jgi:metal transporter CNNM